MKTRVKFKIAATAFIVLITSNAFASTKEQTYDCLFDFAQVEASDILKSSKSVNGIYLGFYYRYFDLSDNYLAVSLDDSNVYFYDTKVSNELISYGNVEPWLVASHCTSSEVVSRNPSTPVSVRWNQTKNSISLSNAWESTVSIEAATTFDFDNDGNLEFFIPPGNQSWQPRMASDRGFSLFELQPNGNLTYEEIALTGEFIPGHINSDILKGNFGNSPGRTLIFIDHGREPSEIPFKDWELAYLWRLDETNSGWKVSEFAKDAGRRFWHSGTNPIDIDSDGMDDFAVGTLSSGHGLYVFLSDNDIYRPINFSDTLSSLSGAPFPTCGAASLIKLATGNFGSICLPYTMNEKWGSNGYVLHLSSEGDKVVDSQALSVRDLAETLDVPNEFGFHLIRVLDLNDDGLDDFLALAEVPSGLLQKSRPLLAFIQDSDANFRLGNNELNLSVMYNLENMEEGEFKDWTDQDILVGKLHPNSSNDLFWGMELISAKSVETYGIRGVLSLNEGKYTDNSVPPSSITWNTELPDGFRYIWPVDLNKDGVMDFVLLGSIFDQERTEDNKYGVRYSLSALVSQIIR
jgi:hypothetical protein